MVEKSHIFVTVWSPMEAVNHIFAYFRREVNVPTFLHMWLPLIYVSVLNVEGSTKRTVEFPVCVT